MALIKWSPFFDIEPFEEMDKIKSGFTPAIDMYEDKNNVVVETQLSGIDPDKVSVSIENDVLCIKGESEKKSEIDEKNYYRKEIHRGGFYRSVPLPTHVFGDKAKAVANGGVLKIIIPKASKTKAKNIKVETKKK
ncbi:MAG: Hsp20/alpha crystallin family protein [Patescibacteria group bacterium]|nr:Hsp20/alpha crystallin family protein [Patescibacteria group bacterium]